MLQISGLQFFSDIHPQIGYIFEESEFYRFLLRDFWAKPLGTNQVLSCQTSLWLICKSENLKIYGIVPWYQVL